MVDIDKAIQIAKKLNPDTGPSLEMSRKSLSDDEMIVKLERFFDDYERAMKVVEQHPGKNYQQIKAIFDANTKTHVNNLIFISTFVNDVLDKKGDLNSLAKSAARRVVLADERLNNFYAENKKVDPATTSKKIAENIEMMLIEYFTSLKGTNIDRGKIIDELTREVTISVAKSLQDISGGDNA